MTAGRNGRCGMTVTTVDCSTPGYGDVVAASQGATGRVLTGAVTVSRATGLVAIALRVGRRIAKVTDTTANIGRHIINIDVTVKVFSRCGGVFHSAIVTVATGRCIIRSGCQVDLVAAADHIRQVTGRAVASNAPIGSRPGRTGAVVVAEGAGTIAVAITRSTRRIVGHAGSNINNVIDVVG